MAILILLGAFLYRWRGMEGCWPRPIPQVLFTAPYALVTALCYAPKFASWAWAAVHPIIGWGVFAALVLAVWTLSALGALTGHGRGIDLSDTDKGEPEKLEFVIRWAKPYLPLYWYDMALLSVTGLAVTLPAGIATLNPALALSGALKGPTYGVAKFGNTGTDGGELLTGAMLWAAFAL